MLHEMAHIKLMSLNMQVDNLEQPDINFADVTFVKSYVNIHDKRYKRELQRINNLSDLNVTVRCLVQNLLS